MPTADLTFELQAGTGLRTTQINERMQAPLPAALMQLVADEAIRRGGDGSVEDQFARQAEMNKLVTIPWKRTQPFGTRKMPSRTLHDKGNYEAAWTGRGSGSVTTPLDHGVRVGVDHVRFPQVFTLQRSGITVRRATQKQRFYLGMTYDVWLKRSTTTLKTEGRPVSLNRGITERARSMIVRYYFNGQIAGASLGKAA